MAIRILRWSARILMILAIIFMFVFSFDVFDGSGSFGRKMLGFLISNIPVLILTAFLVVAWKRELAGGILIILATITLMIKFHVFTSNTGALIIFVPFLLSGLLFISACLAAKTEKNNLKP